MIKITVAQTLQVGEVSQRVEVSEELEDHSLALESYERVIAKLNEQSNLISRKLSKP